MNRNVLLESFDCEETSVLIKRRGAGSSRLQFVAGLQTAHAGLRKQNVGELRRRGFGGFFVFAPLWFQPR